MEEKLFLVDDRHYLHVQECDEGGYDYTFYDKESYAAVDGGRMDEPEEWGITTILQAAEAKKNHKHVAIVSIREPESGEYAEFYGTVSPGGSMGPELTQFVLREIESWISLKQDEQEEAEAK